ncbi:MAG: TRAP transporter substrate-binding protein [Deltaproteobacteria bacterium]|nr:TRAP transporter substrate-binding protein [Deltaproteobacteria bacterium]MBW2154081.1 TRAP transporter substrate-binding protein [Deltaproteobacteria bacterium]
MKRLIFVLIALGIAFSMFASSVYGAKAEFLVKVCVPTVPGEPPTIAMKQFAKIVEERSNGRIKFEVYVGGALGNDRDLIEGLQLGTVQLHMASNSPLAVFVPELNIFELPFLFKDNDHFDAVLGSKLALRYAPALEKRGFHLLGYWSFGTRHIMTIKNPIHSMADLKGLKIRLMENPVHLDAFKTFGASPLPMAYSELYTALETGVIDGAEAANSNYWGHKFYEVAPNWAQVGWLRLVAPLIMSKAFYDKLPSDLQKIVTDSAQEISGYQRDLYAKRDDELLGQLKAKGVKVTYPDRTDFINASKAVYDKWAKKVGGRDKINEIANFKY